MSDRLFLELVVGDDRTRLRLALDARGESAAAARLGEWALAHLDRTLPARLRDGIPALARACVQLGGRVHDEASALRGLGVATAHVWPGARLTLTRRVLAAQRTPQWPVSIRSGAPTLPSLWPFDAELAGMLLGTRRLLLREWLDESGAAADASWLSRHGLATRVSAGGEGRRVLFAARDAALLDEALRYDLQLSSSREGFGEAVRWLGDALGYPSCCVERFSDGRARDDLSMMIDLLPPLTAPPALPLVQWLDGALALLSFAPCSPSCPRALDLAARLLDALEAERPGFAARFLELATAVHVIDETGRCLALQASGSLAADGALLVERARVLAPPQTPSDAPSLTDAHELDGAVLRLDRGRLVDVRGSLRATLVADHRAAVDLRASAAMSTPIPSRSAVDGSAGAPDSSR